MTTIYIHPETKQINISFWDVITKQSINKNTFTNLEKAIEKANEWDIEYYSKHSNLLPKGISIATRDRKFKLTVTHPKNGKSKDLGSFKTVALAKEARKKLIENLIDL